MVMKTNIIVNTATVLLFAVIIIFSFELYSVYLQSLVYLPLLFALLGVFGILSYYKYNKKLRARYFILAYFVLFVLPTFILLHLNSQFFILFAIVFDLTIIPFVFLIDKDEEEFMKRQNHLVRIGIDFAELIFALFIIAIFVISYILIYGIIMPEQTSFLPNINATIYYSSSNLYYYKPLNTPNNFLLANFFNSTNKTTIEGIINIIKSDNISYENSARGYCLNGQTNKYWIQDCISYSPYSASFISNNNYFLVTEIWHNNTMILGEAEIIPNSSIYKNQTFYLKLAVENNTAVAYETNNGKTEYIKVVLPENQSFGNFNNNSSIYTEIHEWNFYSLNTGLLGLYGINDKITSLSGNFTTSIFEWDVSNAFILFESLSNYSWSNSQNPLCEILPVNNTKNTLQNICFEYKMNNTQLEDLKDLEDGNCNIYYQDIRSFGSFNLIAEVPIAVENTTDINLNTTLCNSNEDLLQYLSSKVLPMFSGR